jgi:hypothetical protein
LLKNKEISISQTEMVFIDKQIYDRVLEEGFMRMLQKIQQMNSFKLKSKKLIEENGPNAQFEFKLMAE